MAGPFTPSPSCTTDIYYVSNPSGSYFHLGPPTSTAACFPRSWSPSASAFISTSYCPSGYTIACANTAFPEKTGTCCPGYVALLFTYAFPAPANAGMAGGESMYNAVFILYIADAKLTSAAVLDAKLRRRAGSHGRARSCAWRPCRRPRRTSTLRRRRAGLPRG